MGKSKVKVVTTIYFGKTEYSLQYQISEEFDSKRTKNCISLCEHAIMQGWCDHLNINGIFTGHWLPSGRSSNVIFTGCPIEVVKETAALVCRIIDAEKVEEVTVDVREKIRAAKNQMNRQGLQVVGVIRKSS